MGSLEGKVAVVTGAAAGLGRAIAEAFAREGARVVVADRDEAGAQAVAATLGGGALAKRVDVADPSQVDALFAAIAEATGRVDILVNNAGLVSQRPLVDIADDEIDRVLGVNLKGVILCARAAGRLMIPARSGCIINIASTSARVSSPGFSLYSATKGGVAALTRALAVEWGPYGIRVNSISPGSIETDMYRAAKARDPEGFAKRDKRVPLGRTGQPHQIGAMAVVLASDASEYVTGHDVLVDGGMLAQHPGFVP